MACLSSRIPTGLEVTEERLTRIEKAERLLRTWGFDQFRVRDHDGLARIEVGAAELDRALDPEFAAAAREHLSDLGFDHVTLDLAGYNTGSVSPAADDETERVSATETQTTSVTDDTGAEGDSQSAGEPVDDEPVVENVFREYPSGG
jgi:hypothetical protein